MRLFHEFIDAVVRKHALATLGAGTALQAVRQGLAAGLYDLRFHALRLKHADHFLQRPHGRAMRMAAAIDEQYFHAKTSPRPTPLSLSFHYTPALPKNPALAGSAGGQ